MIPKLIHHVWVGPKPFPPEAQRFVAGWKRLNPEFTVILWDESNIDFSSRFIRQAYGAKAYNRVSNYARMSALFRHGGIYLDHDIELIRPLNALLKNDCFAGFQTMEEDRVDLVNNAVVGAVPGQSFIKAILTALDEMNGAENVGSSSGPGLLSKILREHGPLHPSANPIVTRGVTLYPPRFFYPYEWDEEFQPECVTEDTLGIHRWAHTWKPNQSIIHRTRRLILSQIATYLPEVTYRVARLANRISRPTETRFKAQHGTK